MTHRSNMLIAASLFVAVLSVPATAAGLDAYLWKARPVIVFAPHRDADELSDQLNRLTRERAALAERDMPVLVVTDKTVTAFSGDGPPAALKAEELRKAYGVSSDGFAIVLVGKDGGEKLRSTEPIDADRLTRLVDTMPMRRSEGR